MSKDATSQNASAGQGQQWGSGATTTTPGNHGRTSSGDMKGEAKRDHLLRRRLPGPVAHWPLASLPCLGEAASECEDGALSRATWLLSWSGQAARVGAAQHSPGNGWVGLPLCPALLHIRGPNFKGSSFISCSLGPLQTAGPGGGDVVSRGVQHGRVLPGGNALGPFFV